MDTRKMFLDARLIHSKVSVDPTRICFPYDWKKAADLWVARKNQRDAERND